MAESGGLENRCPETPDRGFESYLLRQTRIGGNLHVKISNEIGLTEARP